LKVNKDINHEGHEEREERKRQCNHCLCSTFFAQW